MWARFLGLLVDSIEEIVTNAGERAEEELRAIHEAALRLAVETGSYLETIAKLRAEGDAELEGLRAMREREKKG